MAGRIERVVIMVQENHTVDNYFRGLATVRRRGGRRLAALAESPGPGPGA